MKLLVSAADEKEAAEAIAGGTDIVDVKNPKEGTLGASFPWVITGIRKMTVGNIEISCTIGDLPNLPGSVSLAALGAAVTGVNYIKVGLGNVSTAEDAVHLLEGAVRAAKDYDSRIKIVVTGYADAGRVSSIDPVLIPEIADRVNADVAMIDTAVKDGNGLFTFLTENKLKRIVGQAHARGLLVALAGSIAKEQISRVYGLEADIVGLRGAVCTNGDRTNGRIIRETVSELAGIVKRLRSTYP